MNTSPSEWTQACEDRDFVEWHRGCPWCAVWMVWLDLPELQVRVAQSRAALQPFLLPRYERQPHISLAYRGLMSGDEQHPATEFALQVLHADIAKLQALQLAPWQVTVQGAESFTTVPYLAVADAGQLQRVHGAMSLDSPAADWRYVPHVTLGHYARTMPIADVMAAVQPVEALHAPCVKTVDRIWLARYRTDDIAGPLVLEGCWDLALQRYVPQPGALLRPSSVMPV